MRINDALSDKDAELRALVRSLALSPLALMPSLAPSPLARNMLAQARSPLALVHSTGA